MNEIMKEAKVILEEVICLITDDISFEVSDEMMEYLEEYLEKFELKKLNRRKYLYDRISEYIGLHI